MDRDEFVRIVGPVYEHSPWIAERTWARRPFASVEVLHRALSETVSESEEPQKLQLIQAHPDLVGRAARSGTLTSASRREQAGAGLDKLSRQEAELFQKHNLEYREKFGFPFVICARLNRKEAILSGFGKRLRNSQQQELETALVEIAKIARLRLQEIVADKI